VATDASDLQPVRAGKLRKSQRVCLKVEIDVIIQWEHREPSRANLRSGRKRAWRAALSADRRSPGRRSNGAEREDQRGRELLDCRLR
jgi:hypothetical protein